MTDPARLSPGHTARPQDVLDNCLEPKQATEHVRTFATLLTQRQGHRLNDWINEARASNLQPLRSFAEGLLIDHDAVVAGLTLPYSNGPAEGVIVLSSVVVGVPDDELGQVGYALVEADAAAGLDEHALFGFLRERLAEYKLPRRIEFRAAPLRDASGKVRRSAIRDEIVERLRAEASAAP